MHVATFQSNATAGTGFGPMGNLRTTDQDGPYSLQYVPVQVAEVKGEYDSFAITSSPAGSRLSALCGDLRTLPAPSSNEYRAHPVLAACTVDIMLQRHTRAAALSSWSACPFVAAFCLCR